MDVSLVILECWPENGRIVAKITMCVLTGGLLIGCDYGDESTLVWSVGLCGLDDCAPDFLRDRGVLQIYRRKTKDSQGNYTIQHNYACEREKTIQL